MRKQLLFAFLGVLTFSCSNSYDLLENDMELAKASEDYELTTRAIVADEDSAKIETIADPETIQALMDEYETELMNRTSVAKQKVMRTLYNTTCDVVGVFKVGSCGVYKELSVNIDTEDTRQNSKKEGSVGDSYIDSNGNVRLKFCLTEASQYYPGGVFLVDHIDYAPTFGGTGGATMQILLRYHDCDDKRPKNSVSSGDSRYNSKEAISKGFTLIDNNAVLAWAFPSQFKLPAVCSSYFGPKSLINYGVLAGSTDAISGRIHFDDEDTNNTNWAKIYKDLTLEAPKLDPGEYPEYGVLIGENTWYNLTLSTHYNLFVTHNKYYPAKLTNTCN